MSNIFTRYIFVEFQYIMLIMELRGVLSDA
jgi:hypothetical protein